MSRPATQESANISAIVARMADSLRRGVPAGRPLPDGAWQRRHLCIVVLLWLHAIGLAGFGLLTGHGLAHSLAEAGLVGLAAGLAGWRHAPRRARAAIASLGLITASGVLVHLSGGLVEMHFHFFVMVVVIALYQDWVPFLFALGYVVLHHGLVGVLDPVAVYNHPDAWANPWKWAAIHGAFVLAISAASMVHWRLNEAAQDALRRAYDELEQRVRERTAALHTEVAERATWRPPRRSWRDSTKSTAAPALRSRPG